jgi:hypothetical protein
MPRYVANTALIFKIETTPGIDAVPTGTADAVLLTDITVTPLDANNIDRQFIRPYFGGFSKLVGPASVKLSFSVELGGSGTAATAPQWGDLLLACAHAEALLTTPSRVEYTPVSSSLKTATIYYYDDGVMHKLLGCMGNVKLSAPVGDRPKLSFDFIGLDGGISTAALPTVALTAWNAPPVVAKANVVDVTLGCTYATGALTGGTTYSSAGLEIDWGNDVKFTPLLGSESVDITNRNLSGKLKLDLTAAQEVAMYAAIKSNTLQGLGFTLGTVSGNKMLIHAPQVQLVNPTKEDVNGRRLIGFDLEIAPLSGNDDIRIVCV